MIAAKRPVRVILVGLGTVARTHLKALEQIVGTTVLAGVDPVPPGHVSFHGLEFPVYATVRDAAARHDPSHIVIATPSSTHAAVCNEVVGLFPEAAILVEKPAATNFAEARQLLHGVRRPLDVAYHMAFSPEVLWGADLANAQSDALGPPVAVVASFADPYEAEFRTASNRFGSSWVDSGINALSVVNRFVEPVERKSLRSIGPESWSTFEGRVRCRTGDSEVEALILTTWHVTAPARTTRIRYASGAELVMDHHGVAGYLIRNGKVDEFFGSDGSVPRRESHYRSLYYWYLVKGKPVMSRERSLRLHDILLRAEGTL